MSPRGPDDAAIDALFAAFVATGRVPDDFALVQGRLVRAVHAGTLPSGPVFVKAMTFPRAKDRWRYLLRPLPAAHEARLLRAVAAASVPCPDVVAVRVARRHGWPFRSLLVLRAMPVAQPSPVEAPLARLREEATIAARLLGAGIAHRDLHGGNFLRLADGALAVIDLQSASRVGPWRAGGRRLRVATAARLLRDRAGADGAHAARVLRDTGLLRDEDEVAALRRRLAADRHRYARTRWLRCLRESTEFTVEWRWAGRVFRQRAGLGPGRWVDSDRARAAWLGQRVLQLADDRAPVFRGYFRKWWWFGGGEALYVPAACTDERLEQEITAAAAGTTCVERLVATTWPEGEREHG